MAKRTHAKFQLGNMKEEEDAAAAAANILVWMSSVTLKKKDAIELEKMKIKIRRLRYPPIPFLDDKIDRRTCSVPFEKQLTATDVNEEQNRLSLCKDEVIRSILPLLDRHEDLYRGVPVTTYNPEGKAYEMAFKSWSENKFYVLNGGWKRFFRENGLAKDQHWVTVWMFRHIQTRKPCFALTWNKHPILSLVGEIDKTFGKFKKNKKS